MSTLVGVVDDDDDDNVKGVDEEVVYHLQVGGLGHHVVDTTLDVSNNQHTSDRHHDAVLMEWKDINSAKNRAL